MNPLDLVDQFHKAFAYRQPTPIIPTLDAETIDLRMELLREEREELRAAMVASNRAEQLDALCDIQYVLSGAVLAFGMRSLVESIASNAIARHSCRLEAGALFILFSMKMSYAGELLRRNAPDKAALALVDLQVVLLAMVRELGFEDVFPSAFVAVHENNMRKLWPHDTAMMGNWPDLAFEASSQAGMYIARRADGKIVKPPGFAKVDLSSFVL